MTPSPPPLGPIPEDRFSAHLFERHFPPSFPLMVLLPLQVYKAFATPPPAPAFRPRILLTPPEAAAPKAPPFLARDMVFRVPLNLLLCLLILVIASPAVVLPDFLLIRALSRPPCGVPVFFPNGHTPNSYRLNHGPKGSNSPPG